MNNLIRALNQTMQLSPEQILQGMASRGQSTSMELLSRWLVDDSSMPETFRHNVVMWIMELWAKERDACSAKQLLDVDNKFSRILRDYNLTDIIAFKKELQKLSET